MLNALQVSVCLIVPIGTLLKIHELIIHLFDEYFAGTGTGPGNVLAVREYFQGIFSGLMTSGVTLKG